MSGLPTIRKWWEGRWQILGCPCSKPAGEHGYPSHAEAILHISEAYANDFFWQMTARHRSIRRIFFKAPKHKGNSFTRENA